MASLNLAEFSLADPDNLADETIFDVDPSSYDPLNAPVRGSSFQAVDGGTINQVFGVFPGDFAIDVQGQMVTDTVKALWTRYRNRGKIWRLEDWFGNKFNVIFRPGMNSFHPTPLQGSCELWTYTMNFQVCEIVQWFGGDY